MAYAAVVHRSQRGRVIRATAEQGPEEFLAKRLDAPYSPGRRSDLWVKRKHLRRERLVVAGWRQRDGELPEFLLARRHGGALLPAGSASLGLDAADREGLLAGLADHERTRPRRPRFVASGSGR